MAEAAERKRQSILRTEIAWMQRGARARSTKQKAHIQRYEQLRDQEGPEYDRNVQLESIGSRQELFEKTGDERAKTIELHRPYLDDLTM